MRTLLNLAPALLFLASAAYAAVAVPGGALSSTRVIRGSKFLASGYPLPPTSVKAGRKLNPVISVRVRNGKVAQNDVRPGEGFCDIRLWIPERKRMSRSNRAGPRDLKFSAYVSQASFFRSMEEKRQGFSAQLSPPPASERDRPYPIELRCLDDVGRSGMNDLRVAELLNGARARDTRKPFQFLVPVYQAL
jgi:hypothetical protein